MKNKVIVLKGLPASGKSTWAKEFVENNPGWLRLNKDDLRQMLHNNKWSKGNEKQVLMARDATIKAALTMEYNVVVDDTNFAPQHLKTIKKIAEEFDADVEVKYFDVSLEECLARNQNRPNKVPDNVIEDMYYRYIFPDISKTTK